MPEDIRAKGEHNERLVRALDGLSPKELMSSLIEGMSADSKTAREIVNKLQQVVDAVQANSATDVRVDVSVSYDSSSKSLNYGFRVRGQ